MTRKTKVLDCKPVKFLALSRIGNRPAQTWLQEFYGRKKIPMDPKATLSEHQVPIINDGYVTHGHFIFENRARYLSTTKDETPAPRVTQYATSGALASSLDSLLADSDLMAYRSCHWRDCIAGTPELIHRRHHRRAASLSLMTTG